MIPLSVQITREQERRIEARLITLTVDLSPIFPGCFIARDEHGCQGAGRTPRQAIDSLEARAARADPRKEHDA